MFDLIRDDGYGAHVFGPSLLLHAFLEIQKTVGAYEI